MNLEDKRGKLARITIGDPLPDDQVLLPSPERLRECCSDAVQTQGIHHPPPPVNVSYLDPDQRADVEQIVMELRQGGREAMEAWRADVERNRDLSGDERMLALLALRLATEEAA